MASTSRENRNNPEFVKKRLIAICQPTLEKTLLSHQTDPFEEGDSLLLERVPGILFVINALIEDDSNLLIDGYFALDDEFEGEPSVLAKQFKIVQTSIEGQGRAPEDFFRLSLEVSLDQQDEDEDDEEDSQDQDEDNEAEDEQLKELREQYNAQLQELLNKSGAIVQLGQYFEYNPQDKAEGPDKIIKSSNTPGLAFEVLDSEVRVKGKVTKIITLRINDTVKRKHNLVEGLEASLTAIGDTDVSDQVFSFELELDVPGVYPEGEEPQSADPALVEVLRGQINPIEKELLENPNNPRFSIPLAEANITMDANNELNITFNDAQGTFCVVDVPKGISIDAITEGDQLHLIFKGTFTGKNKRPYHRYRPKTPFDIEWFPEVLDAPNGEARLQAFARLEQEIENELAEAADQGVTHFRDISQELADKITTAQTLRNSLGLFNKQYKVPRPKKVSKGPDPSVPAGDPADPTPQAPEKKMGPPTFNQGDYLEQAKVEVGHRNLVVLDGGSEYSLLAGGKKVPRNADDSRTIIVRGLVRPDGTPLTRGGEVPKWWKPTAENYRVRIDKVKDKVYEATAVISAEEQFLYDTFGRQERGLTDEAQARQSELNQALITGLRVEDKAFRDLSKSLREESDRRWDEMFAADSAADLQTLEQQLAEEINSLQTEIAGLRLEYLQKGTKAGKAVDTDRKKALLIKELRDKILRLDYLMLLQESWQDRHVEELRQMVSFLDPQERPNGEFARDFAKILRQVLGPFVYEAKYNEKTGELDIVDLDARSAQEIFDLAGVKQIKDAKPVNSGEVTMGAISLDTSDQTGVGLHAEPNADTLGFNEPKGWSGRAAAGSEAEAWRQGTDVAELRAILSGPQASDWQAWFDHHGPEAGQDNSTTKFVYETLLKTNVLTDRGMAIQLARIFKDKKAALEIDPKKDGPEIRKAVERAVDFITKADNFRLPGMDNREAYLRSHKTLIGLYRRMQFTDLVHLFYRHKDDANYDGTQDLTDQELRMYPLGHQKNDRGNPWLLLRHENKQKYIEGDPRRGTKPVTEIIDNMEQEGFLVETTYGKMYVNIDRRLGFGNETTWALSEGTCGCLDWQPEKQHFFVSFPSQDFSAIDFDPSAAKVVRETMIVKPRETKELQFSLRELLHKLGVQDSAITGELKKYVERQEREASDKARVERERAPFRQAISRDLTRLDNVLQGLGISREDERYTRNLTQFLVTQGARPQQARELIQEFLAANS